jgi:hypothetical protein
MFTMRLLIRSVASLITFAAFATHPAWGATTCAEDAGGANVNVTTCNTGTAGTSVAPWLFVHDVVGTGTYTIGYHANGNASPFGAGDNCGFGTGTCKWLDIQLNNNTALTMTSLVVTIQATLGTNSTDPDGVSNCQGQAACNFATSTPWSSRVVTTNPDIITFTVGSIAPGGSAHIVEAISSTVPSNPASPPGARDIWLRFDATFAQTAPVPEPGTLSSFGLALIGLGCVRRYGGAGKNK